MKTTDFILIQKFLRANGMGKGKQQQRNTHKGTQTQARNAVEEPPRGKPAPKKLTARQQKNLERQTRQQLRKERQKCAYGVWV